jgi:hypothetical protein
LRVWFVVAFIPPTIHTKGFDMTRGLDHEKRRAWAAKLERFRASGLTIAKFCAEEKIHVQTFHYWARRIRAAQPSRSTPNNAVAPAGDSSGADARVHFVLAVNADGDWSIFQGKIGDMEKSIDDPHNHRSQTTLSLMPGPEMQGQ